jgi:hypothetical protein
MEARPRHKHPCFAEATGGKFHVSMAWRGLLAPINNASPNGETALTEQSQLLYGNARGVTAA